MKKAAAILTITVFFLIMASSALASLRHFSGTWTNSNPNTRGITALDIDVSDTRVTVHAWGKCHPRDCDWGRVEGEVYAPDVSSNLRESAQLISAEFRSGPGKKLLLIRSGGRNELNVEVLVQFGDRSGRSNYSTSETFVRRSRPAGPRDKRGDCVSFNPVTTEVRRVDGSWKIVDGNHWLFDFGHKRDEAFRALHIIKHYGMNQSCFVGRPHPSFQYMLVSGNAPSGPMNGEDCVAFDPRNLDAKPIRGSWKIVDGRNWLFDFGNNEDEAKRALRIIQKYGFTHSCFVGRPNPDFTYLRR